MNNNSLKVTIEHDNRVNDKYIFMLDNNKVHDNYGDGVRDTIIYSDDSIFLFKNKLIHEFDEFKGLNHDHLYIYAKKKLKKIQNH